MTIAVVIFNRMPNKKKRGFARSNGQGASVPQKKQPHCSKVRKQWSEEQMLAAIDSVKNGGLSGNRSADMYGVPRSTLKDRLSGRVVHGVKPGPISYLSADEEQELADHLLTCSAMGYGKTRMDVRCLVESYLKSNGKL